jgi:hypothetical protein
VHWLTWRQIGDFLKSWQGFLATSFAFLAAIYYGPKKVLETWDWYMDRFFDSKVKALMEEHARRAESAGARSLTIPEISKGINISERRVGKSLGCLKTKRSVRQHGESWLIQ